MIEHYCRHLMLTSRISEGENFFFLIFRKQKVTIMVISVWFSWALDPYSITLVHV